VAEGRPVFSSLGCLLFPLFVHVPILSPNPSPHTHTPSPLSPLFSSPPLYVLQRKVILGLLDRPSSSAEETQTSCPSTRLFSLPGVCLFAAPSVFFRCPPHGRGTLVYGFSRKNRVIYTVDTVCIRPSKHSSAPLLTPCRLRQ
jgi:hypothetical protein